MNFAGFFPYIFKACQIGCNLTDLGVGIMKCLETPVGGERRPFEKIIVAAIKVAFNGLDISARSLNISEKTFSEIKMAEAMTLIFTGAIDTGGNIRDYLDGKISGLRVIEKGVGSMSSIIRAALESIIQKEHYYLSLTEKERANEFRLFRKPGSDRENPEFEKKPIIVEECQQNLETAQHALSIFWIMEISSRCGILSHTIEYQQLARRMRGTVMPLPFDPFNFSAPVSEDQENESLFDLCKLKHIPEELEEDTIFKRFICPITQVPVRDPVGDPTICKENGEIISSVFERSVLVAWVKAHHKSPITNKPLEVHQLIFKPFLKRLIDQRLAFYSDRFKNLAARKLNTIPPSQVQIQLNAEQENPGL